MGIMKHGVHAQLENEANRILRESLQGVTSHSAKSDILTPWKDAERHRREVYVSSGAPDSSVRQGMFHRTANLEMPHLNSRDGLAGLRSHTPLPEADSDAFNGRSTLASFVAEHHLTSFDPERHD